MSRTSKAVLLSALVFPGAGHFYLKKSGLGALLAATTLAAIVYLAMAIVARATAVIEQIQSGEVQPDFATIMELVSAEMANTGSGGMTIAVAVIVAAWLIAIVHSYRLAHAQDGNR